MKQLAFNAFLALVTLLYLFTAINIPQQSLPADIIEANGVPILVSIISLILIAITSVQTYKERKEEEALALDKTSALRLGVIIAMIVVYINILTRVGFIVSMFSFLLVAVTAGGSKKYLFNVLFALVFTIALTLIFGRVFQISLPRGMGPFFTMSFMLY